MIPKSANQTNIHQLRPIEIFLTNKMRKLFSNNFVAKSEDELKKDRS